MIIEKNNEISAKGLFISFEGPEGSGKTTQMALLREYFESRAGNCVVTREPGGTELGENLRKIVKYHTGDEPIYDETEVLLFAASRAQHVRNLIMPALKSGNIVLCDRFMDSTTAYQGYARKLNLKFINALNRFACCGCVPDMTILLDINPETGFERTKQRMSESRSSDRIEAESLEFHKLVREAFLRIAAENPQRIRTVSAENSRELIHSQIVELVNNAFRPF